MAAGMETDGFAWGASRQRRRKAVNANRGRPSRALGIFIGVAMSAMMADVAVAKSAVSCAGAVVAGGAQLLRSDVGSDTPAQLCTFSWALETIQANQPEIVTGSVLMPPGSSNIEVYQGAGFARAMSEPIVPRHGKRGS
jgi:hypothetical protein